MDVERVPRQTACYAGGMNKLFNKTFFNFTLGFVGILLTSFLVAALIAHFDARASLPASAEQGAPN